MCIVPNLHNLYLYFPTLTSNPTTSNPHDLQPHDLRPHDLRPHDLRPPSDVHVHVGRCLGTIVLSHPSRLLDTSDDSLGVSLTDLTTEVERAGRAGRDCSDTLYIVDIVLPLLCR